MIKAGAADFAYRYGEPTYLSFQITIHEKETFLSIEAGGWRHFHITSSNIPQESFEQLHYVLGSNVLGKAETNMAIMEHMVFSKILKLDVQAKLKEYFDGRINAGYKGCARFEGNQFLHSQHHPNFPDSAETDAT